MLNANEAAWQPSWHQCVLSLQGRLRRWRAILHRLWWRLGRLVLSTLNVDDHALTVDVADLQVRELGSSHSGGIERHQPNAVERAESRIDEAGDLLLTQDGRQTDGSLGIRSLRHAPWLFERLDEEEADGCHMLRHGVGGQFSRAEQVRLVLADVLRA